MKRHWDKDYTLQGSGWVRNQKREWFGGTCDLNCRVGWEKRVKQWSRKERTLNMKTDEPHVLKAAIIKASSTDLGIILFIYMQASLIKHEMICVSVSSFSQRFHGNLQFSRTCKCIAVQNTIVWRIKLYITLILQRRKKEEDMVRKA
jgi:hypothetical protein